MQAGDAQQRRPRFPPRTPRSPRGRFCDWQLRRTVALGRVLHCAIEFRGGNRTPHGVDTSRTVSSKMDYLAWARRVNGRWIVHHGLGADAEAYLARLEHADPERLARSVQLAYQLVQVRDPSTDPKPWFYSGLFSLATSSERRKFLARHWLVQSVLSSTPTDSLQGPHGHGVSEPTRRMIAGIRGAIERTRNPA
jgi:hypothetical protein